MINQASPTPQTPQASQTPVPPAQPSPPKAQSFDIWAGKDFGWYWSQIQLPTIIAGITIIAVWLLWRIPILNLFLGWLGSLTRWFVIIGAFAWIGWQAAKKHTTLVQAILAGGWSGLFVGAVQGLLDYRFLFLWGIINGIVIGVVVALIAFLLAGGATKKEQPKPPLAQPPTTTPPTPPPTSSG